jgi:hypothetical protein
MRKQGMGLPRKMKQHHEPVRAHTDRLDNSEKCRLRSEGAFARAGQNNSLTLQHEGTPSGLTSKTKVLLDIDLLPSSEFGLWYAHSMHANATRVLRRLVSTIPLRLRCWSSGLLSYWLR